MKYVLLLAFAAVAQASSTAFLKSEYVSGMNKICIYDHFGSDVAITVRSVDLCPLSIKIND